MLNAGGKMYSSKNKFRFAILMAVVAIFIFSAIVIATAQDKPASTKMPPVPPIPTKGLLDGMAFVGQITSKNQTITDTSAAGAKVNQESIVFANKQMNSAFFAKDGNKDIPYTATKKAGKIFFTAKAKNPTDPAMVIEWNGTVVNNKATTATNLTAEVKQTKGGKITNEYTVKASLRPATPAQ
jgi:hypothetical protein